MPAITCPLCGEVTLEALRGTYQFDPPPNIPGGAMLIPETTWQHCTTCNEDILSLDLESKIDIQRTRRLGLLIPEEIRQVRDKTGLSAADMGLLLGIGEVTYTRWETGRALPTPASDTLMRLIDQNSDVFALLDAEREPNRSALIDRYITSLGLLQTEGRMPRIAQGSAPNPEAMQAVRRTLQSVRDQNPSRS